MLEIKFNAKINEKLTVDIFKDSLPKDIITYLDKIHAREKPKLVYTSFDGDYIGYIEQMVYNAVKNNYVPINPECALGYYLSTVCFDNSKIETMIACISLVLMCDEFWLYIDDLNEMYDLPEGVVAEMVAWHKFKKRNDLIKVMENRRKYINIVKGMTTVRQGKAMSIKSSTLQTSQIDAAHLLNKIDKSFMKDINDRLISQIEIRKMKCRYVSFDFRDEKHKDWARKYCYDNSAVALIANTLINPFIVDVVSEVYYYDHYLSIRTAILNKCNDAVLFFKPHDLQKDSVSLTIDVVSDLYYCVKNNIKFEILSWNDVGVPKFCDKDWAVTKKERNIVFNDETVSNFV